MSTTESDVPRSDQREALGESERNASREQPQNFKREDTEDKVVEILPIDHGDGAIKGIDPEKGKSGG